MNAESPFSPRASALTAQGSGSLLLPSYSMNAAPAFGRSLVDRVGECESSKSVLRTAGGPTVYAVDDDGELTELYVIVLDAAGYRVKAFIDRAEALAALQRETKLPDLLITDYRGRSMFADQFLRECLAVHPSLRILMASGFDQADAEFFRIRPNRFIRKPFTRQEFLQEVSATLADFARRTKFQEKD